MIGNRVHVVTASPPNKITGTLHKLTTEGATVYREADRYADAGNIFIPMHRIVEILDLGRAP